MEEKLQDMDFQFEAPEELNFEAPEFDIDSLEELEVLSEFNQSFDSPDNNEIPSFDIPEEIDMSSLETNQNDTSNEVMEDGFEIPDFSMADDTITNSQNETNIQEETPEFDISIAPPSNIEENFEVEELNIPDAQNMVADAVREKMAIMQNENNLSQEDELADIQFNPTPTEESSLNEGKQSSVMDKDEMFKIATQKLNHLSDIQNQQLFDNSINK